MVNGQMHQQLFRVHHVVNVENCVLLVMYHIFGGEFIFYFIELFINICLLCIDKFIYLFI